MRILIGGLLALTALAAILGMAAQGKATRDGAAARPVTLGKPELPAPRAARQADAASRIRLSEGYGKLPLSFEANRGQTDAQVKFLSRGHGYSLFLTSTEAVLALRQGSGTGGQGLEAGGWGLGTREAEVSRAVPRLRTPSTQSLSVVRMKVVGANPRPRITGLQELPGKVNYFKGNDPTKWRTNIPTYAKVEYRDVYPGVNLVYYGNDRQLEYDFVVAPGADPTAIRIGFQGADKIETNAQGDLVLRMAGGELRLHKPLVYQEVAGIRHFLTGDYVLNPQSETFVPSSGRGIRNPKSQVVGFHVAAYDATKPLVIDPVLSYSTYLGGNSGDSGLGIAVDTAGNAYVTGYTSSVDYPTTQGGLQDGFGGWYYDAFVSKLNPDGTALVYSTYLGGNNGEWGLGIAVDAAANAYVTGQTTSPDYPTTVGAFRRDFGGSNDAFVTKLNAEGSSLDYSTYLGGSLVDWGSAIAIDVAGNATVTGYTSSPDFPTTSGAFQRSLGSQYDAFVTKLNATGSAPVYSTYLGGSNTDEGYGIAVDAAGNAYVTGGTTSLDYPTTAGVFQPGHSGHIFDAFVTKLNSTGSALIYSTYLGGGFGYGIAVDSAGNAYVTGSAGPDYPTTPGAFQRSFGGSSDAFVSKLSPDGSALVYSTFLGGSLQDLGRSIVVDASGNAHVAGYTGSTDYPTTPGAFQRSPGGDYDIFVTMLNRTGSVIFYSTYLVGNSSLGFASIAVDLSGNAYVTGETDSHDLPTSPDALQGALNGFLDAFVTKIPAPSTGTSIYGVVNANGRPVTGVEVRLFRDRPLFRSQPPTLITTGGGGYYVFTGLQPGMYWLHVVHPGFKSFMQLAQVVPGEDRRVDVSFTGGGTPTLTLNLIQSGFGPRTITLFCTVTPDFVPMAVDAFVWLTLPGGAMLFLQADGSFTAEVRPMVRNWIVTPFSGEIFGYNFRGNEPKGNYTWNAAFTVPGGNPQTGTIGPIVAFPFSFLP